MAASGSRFSVGYLTLASSLPSGTLSVSTMKYAGAGSSWDIGPSHSGWFRGRGVTNGVTLGLLMASFSLMQFFFAPTWGRISDRRGRRPILLLGLFGSVLFYSLFGFAASLDPATSATLALVLFFAARIGAGI